MYTRVLLCVCALFLCGIVSAIEKDTLSIKGVVYDHQSLDPLPGATVQLLGADSSMVAACTTRANGHFLLSGITRGNYQLRVSYVGYRNKTVGVKLPAKINSYRINDILLREEARLLSETVVTAQAAEMTVVEDTMVYHADAFRLPEGAAVEELIKKLPGITQDTSGKYLYNGKVISRFLVDGKDFFKGNPDLLLKNLPTDIIEKVKAYDKQSDMARMTGVDDGEENIVLDFTVKKGMKRGWMGNVAGGCGTRERYEGRAVVNRFVGEQKFSVVGNAGTQQGSGNRFNQRGGMNLTLVKPKVELTGGATVNASQGDNESWSNSESFENVKAAFSNRYSYNDRHGLDFNVDFKLEWKPDTLTTVIVSPNVTAKRNRARSSGESASFNDDPYVRPGITDPLVQLDELKDFIGVNHHLNARNSTGASFSGRINVQANRRLAKPGRNVHVNLNAGGGSNDDTNDSYSRVDYYQLLGADGGDSVYHKIQYNEGKRQERSIGAGITYIEPVGNRIFLQLSYRYVYKYNDNNRTVSSLFDYACKEYGAGADNYADWAHVAVVDKEQCRYVENFYQNHDARVQLRINRTRYRMTVGINMRPQVSRVKYAKGYNEYDIARSVWNAAPTLDFRYRFSKNEDMRIRYNGSTGQPAITDLIPDTLDNSNPLNVRLGNAGLKPSFTHNAQADYRRSLPDVQRTYALNLRYRITQNAVSRRTEYDDETGGRITRPENISGNWNASADFQFNTALPDKRFTVNLSTNLNYTNSVGYVYRNREKCTLKNTTGTLNTGESLRGTFRNDWLELTVFGSFHYNHSRSNAVAGRNLDTYNFGYGGNTVVKCPWKMDFTTNVAQSSRRGYSEAAMNTNELLWNATLSQHFLKGRRATVSISWYDVLNRRSDVSHRIGATSWTDSRTTGVYSYVMLRFRYRFNTMGGRKGRKSGA